MESEIKLFNTPVRHRKASRSRARNRTRLRLKPAVTACFRPGMCRPGFDGTKLDTICGLNKKICSQ